MTSQRFRVGALAAAVLAALPLAAQEADGVTAGNYAIQQSIEVGGRTDGVSGNESVYDTFVNLHSGLRLYDYSLAAHSLNHSGSVFDDLTFSNFGYGGDPNDVSRLRVSKNNAYELTGTFRRDKNFWDYDLLANPLNPLTSNPSLILTSSPHLLNTVRRTTDLQLLLLPQAKVQVRMGFTHGTNAGPSFSTIHLGTEAELLQQVDTKFDNYQLGADLKLWKRTTVSYDQFVSSYKDNTSWLDQSFPYTLSNGVPVDLGISFNTAAGQPCAKPLIGSFANPSCAGYLAYSRAASPDTTVVTERVSFESNSVQNLNMSGRFSYSSSNSDVTGFSEAFRGTDPRTRAIGTTASGPASAKQISVTADWAGTYKVNDKFRIVDTLRFDDFRNPGSFAYVEASLFQGLPLAGGLASLLGNPASASGCPPPYTAPTCPQHNASSAADLLTGIDSRFLGQDSKYNTFQLEYDATNTFGGRLGYRYAHREIADMRDTVLASEVFGPGPGASAAFRGDCARAGSLPPPGCVFGPNGSLIFAGPLAGNDTGRNYTTINENSLLVGLWSRPNDTLRFNLDVEVFAADNTFTRISPRNLQHYNFRGSYKPQKWASFGVHINAIESRNNIPQVDHTEHNRSYGVSAVLEPQSRFSIDFGYDFDDIYSATDICYALGFGPPPRGSTPCPPGSPAPISAISTYTNKINFVYGNLIWRPIKRVAASVGYSLVSTTGATLILSPTTPPGPLQYNYARPTLGASADVTNRVTLKAAWSYYDYQEKGTIDPTGPRDFKGSLFDFTCRYAF